jgi:hypothetical protein
MDGDVWASAVRSSGDLAGVFEHDGETGYFYLYDLDRSDGHKIVDAIHILSQSADFSESEISIRWDRAEQRVGFFIRDTLWAVFNVSRMTKHGGNYRAEGRPTIPPDEDMTPE